MSGEEFYKFLHNKYFVWKFTSRQKTHQGHLTEYADEEGKKQLEKIKENIFREYNHNPEDTEELLDKVIKIHGLGIAGGSGLLAILFPAHYGTLDQFMVKSLRKIEDLPEYQALQKMNPEDLRHEDGIILENILRRKAKELNKQFGTNKWTPKKIDMVLWNYRD